LHNNVLLKKPQYIYMSLMEQMNVSDEQKISFDFSRFRLPQYVGEFRPLLYKQGGRFCAVLGPDPQNGIFGCGDTPEMR
jgi:hypothetical protein